MSKLSPVWRIFISYLLIIFFVLLAAGAFSQTRLCEEKICVVEFNAYWNKNNSVNWLDSLENCGVIRILITDKEMLKDIQNRYKIQNVPTIIIFNGEERQRFQACLRFKMGVQKEEVQALVDKILLE
tara:strand:- start:3175 stop:3555 length:381 start_codon:yes stop_codon:yes gene_type:complete